MRNVTIRQDSIDNGWFVFFNFNYEDRELHIYLTLSECMDDVYQWCVNGVLPSKKERKTHDNA